MIGSPQRNESPASLPGKLWRSTTKLGDQLILGKLVHEPGNLEVKAGE